MKEWIVTNGIGGYAASTDFGGMNTRKYHGLLIAALNPPSDRTLILSKLDESIEINGKKTNLYTNDANGEISKGYKYQTNFEKNIIPVYTYKVQKVTIEKSISMIYGRNAVAVVYRVMNQKARTKLYLTPVINFRDYHGICKNSSFRYRQNLSQDKVQIDYGNNHKINMGIKDSRYIPSQGNMFYNMHYQKEQERGFDSYENHAVPGTFVVELKPNEDKEITFVCALDGKYGVDFADITKFSGSKIIESEVQRINRQIKESGLLNTLPSDYLDKQAYENLVKKYIVASDNFIVYRDSTKLHTIIAGYPWFSDWGRDSLIAFEGLLLISKRFKIAEEVLLTSIQKVKQGLVPNGFSEYGGKALYNSADASLLLFEAVNKYLEYTGNYDFVKNNLYAQMKSIINYYIDGITLDGNNIYLDEKDYLIVSGTDKTQNTWMDAKVNNIPVTPRNGKAVEINALWYNALRIMQKLNLKWNHIAGQVEYAYLANKCRKSFIKDFYNPNKKCLYDVIKEVKKENPKAPTIDNRYSFIQIEKDDKVRPNQLFSLSLSYPVIDCKTEIARNILITTTQKLLNKYGLRTLAKGEPGYIGVYEGGPAKRDSSYHQGPTWPWLFGLYYNAMKNVISAENDLEQKKALENTLTEFRINTANTFINELINGNTCGSISELYDSEESNKKKNGKGAFAQAWSVAEVFRILLKK